MAGNSSCRRKRVRPTAKRISKGFARRPQARRSTGSIRYLDASISCAFIWLLWVCRFLTTSCIRSCCRSVRQTVFNSHCSCWHAASPLPTRSLDRSGRSAVSAGCSRISDDRACQAPRFQGVEAGESARVHSRWGAAFAQAVGQLIAPIRQLDGGLSERPTIPCQPERCEAAVADGFLADAFSDGTGANGGCVDAVPPKGGAIP